jgi:hypothetical protein
MLFIIDNAGVPSVAKMIKLQPKPAVKGASSDFNGDKFSDAVVADPHADPGGVADAGHVSVLYGNSSVLGGGSVDTLVQGSGAVGNTASAGDRFGSTLAAADLDLAPERARSPTAAHSTLSTISTPESWLGKRTTRTVQQSPALRRTMTPSARSWTAYASAVRPTWRSEFPPRTSEARPMPAACSSSLPQARRLLRALD